MNRMGKNIISLAAGFVLIAAMSPSAGAQTVKPDFSGKWTLDKAASQGDRMATVTSGERSVDHKDPKIKIKKAIHFSFGSSMDSFSAILDGVEREEIPEADPQKPVESEGSSSMYSGQEGKTMIKAGWDNNRLIFTSVTENEDGSKSKTETWSLSADGKTLTIEVERNSEARGKDNWTEVYKKS